MRKQQNGGGGWLWAILLGGGAYFYYKAKKPSAVATIAQQAVNAVTGTQATTATQTAAVVPSTVTAIYENTPRTNYGLTSGKAGVFFAGAPGSADQAALSHDGVIVAEIGIPLGSTNGAMFPGVFAPGNYVVTYRRTGGSNLTQDVVVS